MPDESLPARRKIGLERRYDGRQYAADALTRRRNRVFRHRQKKAENWNPGKVSRGEFTTEDTEKAEIRHRLHRCSHAPVARLYYRGADGAPRRAGYAGDTPAATASVRPYFLSKSDTYAP